MTAPSKPVAIAVNENHRGHSFFFQGLNAIKLQLTDDAFHREIKSSVGFFYLKRYSIECWQHQEPTS